MNEVTMRELKRNLDTQKLSTRIPCKVTSDGVTIGVMLKVKQYNELLRNWRDKNKVDADGNPVPSYD